jgi:hypothetical protein
MPGSSLINFGDLGKAAEALINRVSDAVGGIAKPWQVERVAKAEAKAEVIKANARVEVSEIEQRAILRMVREEGRKQENMEAITMMSLEYLNEDACPEKLDEDWLTNFFERSRSFSDDETRRIWAKVLAGEANKAHSFSRRTIDLLATMDAEDAALFSRLCSFIWLLGNEPFLVVPKFDAEPSVMGLTFDNLVHLDYAGLVTFQPVGGFAKQGFHPFAPLSYFGEEVLLRVSKDSTLTTGAALLTRAGVELSRIVEAQRNNAYLSAALEQWGSHGITRVTPAEILAEIKEAALTSVSESS